MSWFDTFILAMSREAQQERKREKKERRARRAFHTDCLDQYGNAVDCLMEAIKTLADEAGPIGLDASFFTNARLAPLYAIGEVLSAQGEIHPDQEDELKALLLELDPNYNYAQFTEATISRTGIYKEFNEIVGSQRESCGSFWLTVFELVYRTRNTDLYQKIVDNLHSIVIYFYNIGEPDTLRPSLICDRIKENMDFHINSYQKTPQVHALMLLQRKLLGKRHLEIKEHYLINEDNIVLDNRLFYVFSTYQKITNTFCGKFAVRKKLMQSGATSHQIDGDLILEWNVTTGTFEEFYRQLI